MKSKERTLKAGIEGKKKKCATYRGTSVRLSVNFLADMLQVRIEWDNIFKLLKKKPANPKLLYPTKLSFRKER